MPAHKDIPLPPAGYRKTALTGGSRSACLTAGLSLKIGGGTVVTLCPSLPIRQEDVDEVLDILGRAIAQVG